MFEIAREKKKRREEKKVWNTCSIVRGKDYYQRHKRRQSDTVSSYLFLLLTS